MTADCIMVEKKRQTMPMDEQSDPLASSNTANAQNSYETDKVKELFEEVRSLAKPSADEPPFTGIP